MGPASQSSQVEAGSFNVVSHDMSREQWGWGETGRPRGICASLNLSSLLRWQKGRPTFKVSEGPSESRSLLALMYNSWHMYLHLIRTTHTHTAAALAISHTFTAVAHQRHTSGLLINKNIWSFKGSLSGICQKDTAHSKTS